MFPLSHANSKGSGLGTREGVIKDAGRAEVVAGLLSGDALSRFPLSVEDFNWAVRSQSAEIPCLFPARIGH